MERQTIYLGRRMNIIKNLNSLSVDLQIQSNSMQNPKRLDWLGHSERHRGIVLQHMKVYYKREIVRTVVLEQM